MFIDKNKFHQFEIEKHWMGCNSILMFIFPIINQMDVSVMEQEKLEQGWFWHYFRTNDRRLFKIKGCDREINGCSNCGANLNNHSFSLNEITQEDILIRLESLQEVFKK